MKLTEGLDYHDLEGQMTPRITVDEYEAKMGKDADVVTLSFVVHSELAAEDLEDWLERGYDFVLDAGVSEGEVESGKYLVFAELNRRLAVPERIVELLSDLETLTNIKLKEWEVIVDDESYDADADVLKQVIILSPHEYREKKDRENELNEYREIAGLNTKPIYESVDEEIKKFISIANIQDKDVVDG